MKRWIARAALAGVCVVLVTEHCPAPIIYRPGEGWTYEPVGTEGAKWVRKRAKEQFEVAKEAFDKGDYKLARRAAGRVVRIWPLSDYAGLAQYMVGRVYEARGMDERAFKEYQKAITRFPKLSNYDEVLQRQFIIATRFLGGQWFKLWGYIPFFPSMDKTAVMFDQVVKNGPYHNTGPKAQMDIGTAREKQRDYPAAVKAYEKAADRYHDRPAVAADALFKAGTAWDKQAKRAEYDQSIAEAAIRDFRDLGALYPSDSRVPGTAAVIASLRTEQARGAFATAKYYEHTKRWLGAVVYYNEVLAKDRNSPYAAEARERLQRLQIRAEKQRQQIFDNEAKIRANLKAASTNLPPERPSRR